MYKIIKDEQSDLYSYWDRGWGFEFSENHAGKILQGKMPKGVILKGSQKYAIINKFITFVENATKNCESDGMKVTILRSAAGYYIGCLTNTGEHYSRLSGYADEKIVAAHWFINHLKYFTVDTED